ncbi:MAG: aminopeptidase, partial [Bacteroidetes bacterium]
MLLRIIQFELKYRLARPATYIYFFLMLVLGFMAMAVEDFFSAGSGQVKENAPTVLAIMSIALSALLGMFVVSALMGVAVLRDFEHRTDAMIFTTPIKKGDYLFGRYLGSLLVTMVVFLGMPLGILLGSFMPWLDAEKMLPVNVGYVFQPFFAFVLPMVFTLSALFFAGGTLSRNILFVYLQGIILLGFYLAVDTVTRNLENRDVVALLDPFALNTLEAITRYWTVAEQNTQVVPLTGIMLQNRLIWAAVGLLALVGTYFGFSFNQVSKGGRRKQKAETQENLSIKTALPQVHQQLGFLPQLRMVLSLSGLYYREIVRSLPFIAIALVGITISAINAPYVNQLYGQSGYPTTYTVLELLEGFNLFFIIILIFYTGELIWKERDLRIDQIYDTTPVKDLSTMAGKFLGFVGVHLTLLTVLLLAGIAIQASYGYFKFELPVYIKTLYGSRLLFLVLFTLLGLFIQSLVNNKFAGHAVFALFFIFTLVMGNIGLEHGLFRFASGSLGSYSDMNTFGHFIPRFAWYKFYWACLAAVFFAVGTVFSVRGTDTLLKTRSKLAARRFSRPLLIFAFSAVILFVGSGAYILYNTTVVNSYANSDAQEKEQAEYEKTLKKYEKVLKPRIVETSMKVDIYPESRDYTAEGYYILKNKTLEAISDLHIQLNNDRQLALEYLNVSLPGGADNQELAVKEAYDRFFYKVYTLPQPLAAGDSIRMNFKVKFTTTGFEEGPTNTTVLENGTFFNNMVFPQLGYQEGAELADDNKRRKQGLAPKERLPERNDSLALRNSLFGDNSDRIRFEIVMGTSPDQIAIAPGYLQKEWTEGNRRYFHYKMDIPMANFYSMVSARYEVLRETWTSPAGQTIPLEIYYHKGHEYNLQRMMKGMRDALTYNSLNFSPYQYRQMRI